MSQSLNHPRLIHYKEEMGESHMIRDMEILLNSIISNEIKLYMSEALNCYSVGAYKACVIMSMIGGMHDLHNKIKGLAPSIKEIRDLEDEIAALKKELRPYERVLIEKCVTDEINILGAVEGKELSRCLDIRNDCAHPSDYICAPETARCVFATIIDLLASKPVLLGHRHISGLIDDINKPTFFPMTKKEDVAEVVQNYLGRYSKRIFKPLAKKLVQEIMSDEINQNSNKLLFLANMATVIADEWSEIITPLLLEPIYSAEVMIMLAANESLVEHISDDQNVKRLLSRFNYYTDNRAYFSVIENVYLCNRVSKKEFDEVVSKTINCFSNQMTDIQCDIWLNIVKDPMTSNGRKQIIKNQYKNAVINSFEFLSQNYQKLVIECADEALFTNIIQNIMHRVSDMDYTVSNPATIEFSQLNEEFLNQLSQDNIKSIIYSITQGTEGYGREVKALFDSLEDKPIFQLYCQKNVPTFGIEDMKEIMGQSITVSKAQELIEKICDNVTGFLDDFLEIAQRYLVLESDEDEALFLGQLINKLKN